jgi:uncharacterized iron-regulated protein
LVQDILRRLSGQGTRLVLAMEQFEFFTQPVLNRSNAGTINLQTLAQETALAQRWPAHTNYLALLSAARQARIPVLAFQR